MWLRNRGKNFGSGKGYCHIDPSDPDPHQCSQVNTGKFGGRGGGGYIGRAFFIWPLESDVRSTNWVGRSRYLYISLPIDVSDGYRGKPWRKTPAVSNTLSSYFILIPWKNKFIILEIFISGLLPKFHCLSNKKYANFVGFSTAGLYGL